MGGKSREREYRQAGSHSEGQAGASTRPKPLRNREVSWEGSHRSKLMSRRTERPYKVDGTGELAQHSAAQCSVPEINGPVVQPRVHVLTQGDLQPEPVGNDGSAVSNDR